MRKPLDVSQREGLLTFSEIERCDPFDKIFTS